MSEQISGGSGHGKPEGQVGDDVDGGASGTQPAAGVGGVSPGLAALGYQKGAELTPDEALRAGVPEGNPYWSGNEIKVAGREGHTDAEGAHPGD